MVRRICLNRSGSPSVMCVEHLCQWLISATRNDSPDATNWLKVVGVVQADFRDGVLAEECTCQAAVLIPKGIGDFWGIVLIEVL